MTEQKRELTIATDGSGASYIYQGDVSWFNSVEKFGDGVNGNCLRLDGDFGIPPGHKALLTIGEAVDCRLKAVPQIWLCRGDSGKSWVVVDKRYSVNIDESEFPSIPEMHKCRIAWDENGIRLIGTPEMI